MATQTCNHIRAGFHVAKNNCRPLALGFHTNMAGSMDIWALRALQAWSQAVMEVPSEARQSQQNAMAYTDGVESKLPILAIMDQSFGSSSI